MMKQLQEIHQLICACARPTVENSSQYYKPVRNESKMRFLNWQPVENTEEMEKLANFKVKDEGKVLFYATAEIFDIYMSLSLAERRSAVHRPSS